MIFGIVVSAESPSEAWTAHKSYQQPDSTTEIRGLNRDFNNVAMTPEENRRVVDRIVQHLGVTKKRLTYGL